jgi:hypothetical protein
VQSERLIYSTSTAFPNGADAFKRKPLGRPAAAQDFGDRPAVNVVAGREMISVKSDVRRRPEVTGDRPNRRE